MKSFLKKYKKILYFLLSAAFLLCLWQFCAAVVFRQKAIIPTIPEAFRVFFRVAGGKNFWRAIGETLLKCLVSFSAAFVLGLIAAAAAHFFDGARYFLSPIVSVLRAAPTLAVTFLLFMFVSSFTAAVLIGVTIVFPIAYANLSAAFSGTSAELTAMARVYRMPFARRFGGIYLPAAAPHIFATLRAGFGLNIKVVTAAEMMGAVSVSVGSALFRARSIFDFYEMFVWVVILIAISFVFELVITVIMRLCMPWKYPVKTRFMRLRRGRGV